MGSGVLTDNVINIDNTLGTWQVDLTHKILTDIHDGQTHVGDYCINLFKNLPVGIAWGCLTPDQRDTILLGCNQMQADCSNSKTPEDAIGKTTFGGIAKECDAEAFVANDRYVITRQKPVFNSVLPLSLHNGKCVLLAETKIPLHDGQQPFLLDFFFNVTGLRQSPLKTLQNLIHHQYCNILLGFQLQKNRYYLGTDKTVIPLTNIQASCLIHLATGKTIKEIANILERSTRTIEDHINLLKRKLGVYSTTELIDRFWHNPIRWF